MPSIQILDNPYANVSRDATSGVAALTQAVEARRARQAQLWKMLDDLPENARRSARRAFAENELDVDTDVGPAPVRAEEAPRAAEKGGGLAAIEQATPKTTSLLGKIGAMFAPDPEPAENPAYDENRVSKQTLARLSGDNPALGRSISDAEAKKILERGGKDMNYGGVMTTFEGGSQNPTYTLNGREATDEMVNEMADRAGEAERLANSADSGSYRRAFDANVAKYMHPERLGPEEGEAYFQFGKKLFKGGDAYAPGNLEKTAAAYAKLKTPKGAPAGYQITADQQAPGPEIYDDSVPAQIAEQNQPAQGGTPAPQMVGGVRQSTGASHASSFRGAQGSQFGPQGAVSDEDIANIDFLANDWAGAQTGYSKAMLYAKRIKDPNASAAAMQYVNSKFSNRMQSYDDGVSHEMVQTSERAATRQASDGGRGVYTDGLGENGWLPINGGWQQVFRPHTGDPDVDAIGTLLSVKFKDRRQVIANAMKTVQMAEQGIPGAKALLAVARSKLGTSLSQAKLYPESVANKNALGDGTKGYMVDDGTLQNMASVYEAEQIPEDLDDTSFFGFFGKKYKKGQYVDKENMAGYMKARQGSSTEQPSARKKVRDI